MTQPLEEEILTHLTTQIQLLESRKAVVHLPAPSGLYRADANSHFHYAPEFFIQISGLTFFSFPHESLTLAPGEICIVPRGLPHAEKTRTLREPFRNLVGMLCGDGAGMRIHFAGASDENDPKGLSGVSLLGEEAERLFNYLTDAARIHHQQHPGAERRSRGLLLAFFGGVMDMLLHAEEGDGRALSSKISLCQSLIHESLSRPELSVKSLAREIHCSPDYLSHLFRRETNIALTAYINQERIQQAHQLMRTTTMNVAEIALACGYRDPSYFTRIFKKNTGNTPKAFQQQIRF